MKSFKNSTKKLMMLFLTIFLINSGDFISMEQQSNKTTELNQNQCFTSQSLQANLIQWYNSSTRQKYWINIENVDLQKSFQQKIESMTISLNDLNDLIFFYNEIIIKNNQLEQKILESCDYKESPFKSDIFDIEYCLKNHEELRLFQFNEKFLTEIISYTIEIFDNNIFILTETHQLFKERKNTIIKNFFKFMYFFNSLHQLINNHKHKTSWFLPLEKFEEILRKFKVLKINESL